MADPFSFVIAHVAQIGISYLFPSEGPRLKDLKVSASTYGAAIPWVFGLVRVPGNMIWARKIRERKTKTFGKGGGQFTNNYTYSCTYAMGLCEGPIDGVLRVWADGKIIFDATQGQKDPNTIKNAIHHLFSGGANTLNSKYHMRFYFGSEEQLPDTAVVTTLGSNAPAFRGLAYILFDDMPLADFGNRIPQIAAEVYVGSTQATVLVNPLHEADGTTALSTTYDSAAAAFDWDRNFGYLRYPDHIAQIDLQAQKVSQTFSEPNYGIVGSPPLASLLCSGRDGSIFATFGSGHPQLPIMRLDPYSMQAVASFGAVADGQDNTAAAFVVSSAATASTSGSIEYLLTVGPQGQIGLLTSAALTYQWGAGAYVGGSAGTGAYKVVGADADTSDNPTFYVLWGSGASLTLTKINGATQTNVQTIAGTSLTAIAAVWDSAVPGVIMFWRDGATNYVSKWSLDTGAEAWRQSTPGLPTSFINQSKLLTSNLAWVSAGRLFILDTNTGTLRVDTSFGVLDRQGVGTPDWGDYIARYPEVATAFTNGGWKYAGTVEGYAQWDYENGGKAAGRTVNVIGAENGSTGYQLPAGYTTADASLQAYDSTHEALICLGGINGAIQVATASVGVSVGTIVQELFTRGGLDAAQMDLSALFAVPLRGYGWASGTDIKSILDELKRLYLFDIVEREGVMVAIMRGDVDNGLGNIVDTIPQNALGSSSADATDFWQETRAQEADLPASVTLSYMNYDDNYETSTARSARISNPVATMFSRQTLAMEMNVVMTATEAKTQTNRILYSQWTERTRYDTRLPWTYLEVDPADVINVTMNDGRSYTARVHQSEIGSDFSIKLETYSQDAGAYDGWNNVVADGGGSGVVPTIPPPAIALPFILNTPLLRDQDDTGGSISRYYVGIGNGAPGVFAGGALFRSTNNIDYAMLYSGDSDVEWGTVVGVVPPPAAGPFALDWKTKITIKPAVSWFELESITDDELWAGANGCIIGSEVLQFRDCVENADGTWTIWNLLRCRRGTSYAGSTHAIGERFIFLSNTTISLQGDLINARGQARYFKGVGEGRSLQDVAPLQLLYEPRDLMPYAPADIRRERTTGVDIDITWARCTRLGGNMQDGTGEVALSERYERYEVYILDAPFSGDFSRGAPPAAYRRMYTTNTPAVTYTADEQGVDSFAPNVSDMHVVVYQLSDAAGRGFPAARTITPADQF